MDTTTVHDNGHAERVRERRIEDKKVSDIYECLYPMTVQFIVFPKAYLFYICRSS